MCSVVLGSCSFVEKFIVFLLIMVVFIVKCLGRSWRSTDNISWGKVFHPQLRMFSWISPSDAHSQIWVHCFCTFCFTTPSPSDYILSTSSWSMMPMLLCLGYYVQTSVTQEHAGLPSNRITNTFAYTRSNAQEFLNNQVHTKQAYMCTHMYAHTLEMALSGKGLRVCPNS